MKEFQNINMFTLIVFLVLCTKLPSLNEAICTGPDRCVADKETVTILSSKFEKISNEELNGSCVCLTFCVFTCKDTDFIQCSVSTTKGYGGAIYYYNQKENSKEATIEQCSFENCSAFIGGAIYFYQSKHTTNQIISCTFSNNKANGNGGAISYYSQFAMIKSCVFSKNESPSGSCLYFINTCTKDYSWENAIENCTFEYAPKGTNPKMIILKGGATNKPVAFRDSCFFAEAGTKINPDSGFFFISSETPVLFDRYNVVNGSENSIDGGNVVVTGQVEYNGVKCIIKTVEIETTSSEVSKTTTSTASTSDSKTAIASSDTSSKNDDSDSGSVNKADKEKEFNDATKKFYTAVGVTAGFAFVIIIILAVVLIFLRNRNRTIKYLGMDDQNDAKEKERSEEGPQGLTANQLADDI